MNSYHGINNAADGTDRDGVAKYYSVENGPYGKTRYMQALFYFPGFIFHIFFHFSSFMVVWRLLFWGWGLQLMGFWACCVRQSVGFLGLGLFI